MSQGVQSVDQISVEVAPDWPARALVAGPSMITLATLFLSWPVTTRRMGGKACCSAMAAGPHQQECGSQGRAAPVAIALRACHAPLVRRGGPAALCGARQPAK